MQLRARRERSTLVTSQVEVLMADAEAYRAYGLVEEACECAQSAAALEPGNLGLHLRLFEFYMALANRDAARRVLVVVLTLCAHRGDYFRVAPLLARLDAHSLSGMVDRDDTLRESAPPPK
jgi:hypothetical protein